MRLSLLPEITDEQRRMTADWVRATLAEPELSQGTVVFPLSNKVGVYCNGAIKVLLRSEYWAMEGNSIYVGYRNPDFSQSMVLIERLAVVGAIISIADLWGELHEAYMARAAAILFTSYEGVMSGLIQTEAPVTGLAFNSDRSMVAGKIGDCYHLPNGERVEVDDSWTVVVVA